MMYGLKPRHGAKIIVPEDRGTDPCTGKIRFCEPCPVEVRRPQLRVAEVCALKICSGKIRAPEVCVAEVRSIEIRREEAGRVEACFP